VVKDATGAAKDIVTRYSLGSNLQPENSIVREGEAPAEPWKEKLYLSASAALREQS
jgi:hypothetical protein